MVRLNNSLFSAILIALVLATFPAVADFKDGIEALKRGDYEAAFSQFKPLADQGQAQSQYNIGIMYQHGRGVEKDLELAA